ncbi:hypothetical protein ACQ86F_31670 [Streptomyces venezuelae ATCC 10712]
MSIDWGDAPTWVAGAFAAAAAYYTRGMLKSQRQQIEEQRDFIREQSANLTLERRALVAQAEERRYAQARQVEAKRFQNSMRVRNNSDAAIKDVYVEFGERRAAQAVQVVPAGIGSHELYQGDYDIPVALVGPGRHYAFVDSEEGWTEDTAVVFFTDEDGGVWRLDQEGQLEPAPQS